MTSNKENNAPVNYPFYPFSTWVNWFKLPLPIQHHMEESPE